jgi:hypothetical protein
MENPFLLAVALFESRKITTRLLASARENEPDSGVERDNPIDWRLLAEACGATEEPLERLQSRSASQARRAPQRDVGEGGRKKSPACLTRGSCA